MSYVIGIWMNQRMRMTLQTWTTEILEIDLEYALPILKFIIDSKALVFSNHWSFNKQFQLHEISIYE